MKALVVYESQFGNTQKIAQAIHSGLMHGYDAQLLHVSAVKPNDLENLNLLILGSPTHGGQVMPGIKALIENLDPQTLKAMDTAAFDTSIPQQGQGFLINNVAKFFGNAAPKIATALLEKGAKSSAFEVFWVLGKEGPLKEGELERASAWSNSLGKDKPNANRETAGLT